MVLRVTKTGDFYYYSISATNLLVLDVSMERTYKAPFLRNLVSIGL